MINHINGDFMSTIQTVHTDILHQNNNLEIFLKSLKNKRIDIVVAFASKTEFLIEAMLKNNNCVNLTVGTINYFSDPIFFEFCKEAASDANSKLSFSVDFRNNESIHWKLYLISPETVIIGSPNLTSIGVSMSRDTAVRINDKILYNNYIELIQKIRNNGSVLDSNNLNFNDLLEKYKESHRIRSTPSQKAGNNISAMDFVSWSSMDESSFLPIFIWENDFTEQDIATFKDEIINQISEDEKVQNAISLIGWYRGKKANKPYQNNEVVLHMKNNGSYVRFYEIAFVIYGKGRWWLCAYKYKRKESVLFAITPDFKEIIKQKVPIWYEKKITYLDSKELRKIADCIKKMSNKPIPDSL